MKIGLLLAVYNDLEFLEECLNPWIKLKSELDIKIAICHGQFKEYHELGFEDNDRETLQYLLENKKEDYLYIQNNYWLVKKEDYIYQNEAELRNHGLGWLLKQEIDYFFTIGSDEFYTEEEIKRIVDFINQESNQDYAWFRINYKNYVINKTQWIDGFCPARIWKVNYKDIYKIKNFYWDDDINYQGTITRDIVSYKQLPHKEIPREICHVKHLTWLDDERTRKKIAYQNLHFNGNCSYKIKDGHVVIDYEFYHRNGLPIPIINKNP